LARLPEELDIFVLSPTYKPAVHLWPSLT